MRVALRSSALATAAPRIDRRGYLAACAIGVGCSWNIANVGPAAEAVAGHYGIAVAAVGFFTTAVFAGEFVSMITVARLLRVAGAKWTGVASVALCVLGNLLTLLGGGVALALALRLLVGIGVGCAFVSGAAYVQQLGGSALHQGFYGGISLMSGGSAVAVVPLLSSTLEWRAPFVFAAAAGAACIPLILPASSPEGWEQPAEGGILRLLRERMLTRFAMVHSVSFGLGIVLSNWVVELLTEKGGYGKEAAGLVGAIILVGGIVSRPGGGGVAHLRPQRARALLLATVLCGATGTLLLGFAPALPLAVLATVLMGIGSGGPFGALVAGLGRAFPGSPGAAIAAMNVYALLLITIGTPLVGLTLSLPGAGLIGFAAASALWAAAAFYLPPQSVLEPSAPGR